VSRFISHFNPFGPLVYYNSQMIDKYSLTDTGKISPQFAPKGGVPKGTKPNTDIKPSQTAPVILSIGGERVIESAKWGFIPENAKDNNSIFRYKTYNVASENIFTKPSWASVIRSQRCIIPANGFYREKGPNNDKQTYLYSSNDDSLLGLAGIFNKWTDPEGMVWNIYSMITADTYPILVAPDKIDDWLNPEIDDMNSLYEIMQPIDTSSLKIN